MDAPVHKICCVCRLDVSRQRRTRDPRGNYYCKPCYTTLWEAHCRRLADAQAAMLVDDASAADGGEVDAALIRAPKLPPTPNVASAADAVVAKHGFSLGQALSKAASALVSLGGGSVDEGEAMGHVVSVEARRVKRPARSRRGAIRLSDLLGDEALAEVEAARLNPHREPEIPVSPITNPPVSALLEECTTVLDHETHRDADDVHEGCLHPGAFGNIAIHPSAAY